MNTDAPATISDKTFTGWINHALYIDGVRGDLVGAGVPGPRVPGMTDSEQTRAQKANHKDRDGHRATLPLERQEALRIDAERHRKARSAIR